MKSSHVLYVMCLLPQVVCSDMAKIKVLVIDDVTQEPLPGIVVRGGFEMDNGWLAWSKTSRPNEDFKVTDQQGMCRVQGQTNCGEAGACARKVPVGYYRLESGVGFSFDRKDFLGVWQPDNLVATIRLQRVEHPIPLFVKRVGDHINRSKVGHVDGTNTLFRYDLVLGDYLPPDGHGEVSDLVVESRLTSLTTTNLYRQTMVFYDFTNTMSFPGDGNGMVSLMTRETDGIRLRVAPVEGYERASDIHCGNRKKVIPPNIWDDSYTECDPNRCYYFRIRSRYDENGNLVGGYYGKIYGDFEIGCRLRYGGCSVEFLYYLNPTPLDRNLEWDMKTNLCPNPGNIGERRP